MSFLWAVLESLLNWPNLLEFCSQKYVEIRSLLVSVIYKHFILFLLILFVYILLLSFV
jgi:hypothetical protein